MNAETPQEVVVAELGPPIWKEMRGSDTVTVHKFVQGYSTWMKGTRAILHTLVDIPSFGLWEIPGTLIEKYGLVGVPMAVKITYDADSKVRTVELFDSRHIPDKLRTLQSGSLGIALAPTSQPELQTPSKGSLAGAGRGAVGGAALGSVAGAPVFWIPPLFVFVAGGGAVIGSLTGAVYGAISAEPVSSVEKTEAILKTALQDLRIPERLRDEISTRVRQDLHLEVRSLGNEEMVAAHIQGSYPAFDSRGIPTTLELSPVGIQLRNVGLEVDPVKQLVVTVSARHLRNVDGLEIGSWYFTDTNSIPISLNDWAADNGRAFRAQVIEAIHRHADRVSKAINSTDFPN